MTLFPLPTIPSISKILRATEQGDKKEGIRAWRRKVGDKEAERIMLESRARGKKLDTDIQQYAKTGMTSDPLLNDYLKDFEISHVEAEVRNLTIGYWGRLDAIAKKWERKWIIDWKSARSLKKREYLDEDYELQLSAYFFAEEIKIGDVWMKLPQVHTIENAMIALRVYPDDQDPEWHEFMYTEEQMEIIFKRFLKRKQQWEQLQITHKN